jgi:uncharacterized protein
LNAKELAQRIYQCFDKGDLAGVLDNLAEDVEWELVGPSSIPYFGRYSGRHGVKNFFASLFENEEILEFLPEQFIESGDNVAVIGRERCRSKRTGREFSVRWVQVFKSAGNKITHWCEYIDTAPIVEAYRTS